MWYQFCRYTECKCYGVIEVPTHISKEILWVRQLVAESEFLWAGSERAIQKL
jgi:hypothetical protein